ncbi:hypothetical protein B566_EDAN015753 [Ephemera danica]|nr:hypothetical protein B566_EDAN015753 [Ephemera danica]
MSYTKSAIMSKVNYRTIHEQFMQNHNGTTPLETVLVVTPTAVTIILSNCFALCAPQVLHSQKFLIEFCILVLPLVFHSTLLADYITESLIAMIILCATFLFIYVMNSPSKTTLKWSTISKSFDMNILITNFRGTVNLITAICILAVDFQTFPRRFAKTEALGWGLMDTGVGLFVVANGLVDPVARGQAGSMTKVIRGCIPLLMLGVIRFVSIAWLQYQQHITEYGIHWNFFFTLAITKLLGTGMLKLSNFPLSWAVLCLKIHHVLLVSGVADWVLGDTPRDNIFSANREGLCSLLGYITLYHCSVTLGNWLRTQEDKQKLFLKLAAFAAVMWFLAIMFGPPSRRLADASYIAWILAYSCTMLSLFLVTQGTSLALAFLSKLPPYFPAILAEINLNGFAFFMLANLLTGVINMSVNTLYVAPVGSMTIVITYMFLLSQ